MALYRTLLREYLNFKRTRSISPLGNTANYSNKDIHPFHKAYWCITLWSEWNSKSVAKYVQNLCLYSSSTMLEEKRSTERWYDLATTDDRLTVWLILWEVFQIQKLSSEHYV
jgi:hypothetical protein